MTPPECEDKRKGREILFAALATLLAAFALHWESLRFASIEREDFVRMFSGSQEHWWTRRLWLDLFSARYYTTFQTNDYYRPLTAAYYHASWLAFGSDIRLYQISKVALLASIAFLAWLIARRRLGALWAAGAALLYLALPLHSSVLFRLSFVDDLLATSFGLGTLYAYERARRPGARMGAWSAAMLLTYALALFSKELAMVLPGLALILEGWDPDRKEAPRPGSPPARRLPLILLLTATLAYALRLRLLPSPFYHAVPRLSPRWIGLLLNDLALLIHPSLLSAGNYAKMLAASTVLGLGVIEAALGSPNNALLLLSGIVLPLLPTFCLEGFNLPSHVAAYYLTLPGVAFCWLAASCFRRLGQTPRSPRRALAPILFAAVFFLEATQTRHEELSQQRDFARAALSKPLLEPNGRTSHSRLEACLFSLPKLRGLEPGFQEKLERHIRALIGDGYNGPTVAALFSTEAIYRHTYAYYRLAEALDQKGLARFHAELAAFSRSRAMAPEAVGLPWAQELEQASDLKDEGIALFERGDFSGALEALEKSSALNSDDPTTLISLGAVLAHQGRIRESIACYDRALEGRAMDSRLRNEMLSSKSTAIRMRNKVRLTPAAAPAL